MQSDFNYIHINYDVRTRFAGGSTSHIGSCWCGSDQYCMCTPSLAIDAVIEVLPDPDTRGGGRGDAPGVVLVQRGVPPYGYALPGGFVDVGEEVEAATVREVREETNLTLSRGMMVL